MKFECTSYNAMPGNPHCNRWIAALLLFALSWLGMYKNAGAANVSPGPIEVTDFRGAVISLKKPAQRIVCLIESALSGIYMLEGGDRVVAVSANVYEDGIYRYYAALDERIAKKTLATPGNWDFVNIESVVVQRPDLVIIWANQTEAISAMEEKGLTVYGVDLSSFDDIYKEITDFGKVLGKETRADTLIAYTKKELDAVTRPVHSTPALKTPNVYFMWAQGELETSGAPSTANDLIRLAGGRNVCSHIPQEHTVVNLENVATWNPDVIVMWHNAGKSPKDVVEMPVWRHLSASKQRRVYELDSVFFCDFWTLKFVYTVRQVAAWCHPDTFEGIDLEEEKRYMLKSLYGQDIGERIPLAE